MRPILAIVALSCLASGGAADEGIGLSPGQKMLSPITFRQLALFPVVQTAIAVDKTQYLTLSDGLHKKLVTVAELAGGGSVNTLMVTNKSEKPLLILGGEVVLGGQQDPSSGRTRSCRRTSRSACRSSASSMGAGPGAPVRGGAGHGRHQDAPCARIPRRSDPECVGRGREEERRARRGAVDGHLSQPGDGRRGQEGANSYRAAVGGALGKLPEKDKVVGVIAAVNGRVTSVELFAKPELFAAYRDKLLDSIYMGASDAPVDDKAKPPEAKAIGEHAQSEGCAGQPVTSNKAGKSESRKGDGVMGSTVEAPASATPVYESYQADE